MERSEVDGGAVLARAGIGPDADLAALLAAANRLGFNAWMTTLSRTHVVTREPVDRHTARVGRSAAEAVRVPSDESRRSALAEALFLVPAGELGAAVDETVGGRATQAPARALPLPCALTLSGRGVPSPHPPLPARARPSRPGSCLSRPAVTEP